MKDLNKFLEENYSYSSAKTLPPPMPKKTLRSKMRSKILKKGKVIENISPPIIALLACIIFVFLPSLPFKIIGWAGIALAGAICLHYIAFAAIYFGLMELYTSKVLIVRYVMYISSIALVYFLIKLNPGMMICSFIFCVVIIVISYLTYNKKISWISIVLFMAYIITLFIKIML